MVHQRIPSVYRAAASRRRLIPCVGLRRQPFPPALLLSVLIHTLVLSQLFGSEGQGRPGVLLPWQERRAEVPDLRIVLMPAPAPSPRALAVAPPVGEPAAQSPTTPPVTRMQARTVTLKPVVPPKPITMPRAQPAKALSHTKAPDRVAPLPPAAPLVAADVPLDRAVPVALPSAVPVMSSASSPENGPSAARETAEAALEAQRQEVARQETARSEAARLEAARQAAAQQEMQQQEAARQESARAEAAQLEAARQEAARQATAQREMQRQEAVRQESARAEAAQLEAARQEAARQATAQREMQRQEAARLESARAEAAQLEAARQEATRQAAAQREVQRQEAVRQQASRAEAARLEAARTESDRLERERLQAVQEAAAKREALLRAIGRQLDEEAARREAASTTARTSNSLPLSLSTARRVRLWGRTDPNVELVEYAEAWARRIQFNTGVDTVREVAKRPHADPMVTVAVRSDGSVESITFVVSSGVAEVDEAIRRIVESQKPYPAFPPTLAREVDVVEIRRTWYFDSAVRLY